MLFGKKKFFAQASRIQNLSQTLSGHFLENVRGTIRDLHRESILVSHVSDADERVCQQLVVRICVDENRDKHL